MFKSFRVGSLFGIPLNLDITLLLILPVFAYLIGNQVSEIVTVLNNLLGTAIDPAFLGTGMLPLVVGLVAAIGLFIGVTIHELGHALVSIRFGYDIQSITLWLLGGIAQLEEQPRIWHHEFWISVAGPITSIAIGIVCYGVVLIVPANASIVIFVFGYLAILNIALAIFNMIPAFPLDGGRVLRSLLGRTQPFAKATQRAVQIGKIFAVGIGLFGLLSFNLFMIAIAFFIYIVGAAEGRQTLIASIFEDVPVKTVMTPAEDVVSVSASLPLDELLERMMTHRHSGYPVLENDDVIGMITIDDVRAIPPGEQDTTTVSDVMSTDLVTIEDTDDAMKAFFDLAQHNIGRLIVTDEHGDFQGIITRTDLVRAFDIIRENKLIAENTQIQPPIE